MGPAAGLTPVNENPTEETGGAVVEGVLVFGRADAVVGLTGALLSGGVTVPGVVWRTVVTVGAAVVTVVLAGVVVPGVT